MHSSDYENAVHSYTGKAALNVVLLAHKKFTTMGDLSMLKIVQK